MNINEVLLYINDNIASLLLATIALLAIALIIFLSINLKLNRILKRYKTLMEGMENKNLEELMLANRQMIKQNQEKLSSIDEGYQQVNHVLKTCINKIGVVRYNAFPDMGSDLSYSVAMLDQQENGVVISGLTGREDSRTYAKPVIAGKSTYLLTEEEEQALKKALS